MPAQWELLSWRTECSCRVSADSRAFSQPPSLDETAANPHNRKFVFIHERKQGELMVITGEAIRMMNFVDDITATLRRIAANIPFMTEEERKRLAEYMKKADPSYAGMIEKLEKGS
jgi:hypothetical protein